jgi:hypothetical protein
MIYIYIYILKQYKVLWATHDMTYSTFPFVNPKGSCVPWILTAAPVRVKNRVANKQLLVG